MEARPVVGTDDKYELAIGIVTAEMLESVPRIRRNWKVKLVVRRLDALVARKSLHRQAQPVVVGQNVIGTLFEGIQR